MSKEDRRKPKLTGPWRTLHTVVWLLGLVVLAINNWWWPGILVLVALSMIIEAVLRQYKPEAFEAPEDTPAPASPANSPAEMQSSAPPAAADAAPAPNGAKPEYPVDLLPTNCPKCGAPTRGHEVRWTSPRSADCPFCGSNLPLAKTQDLRR